MCSNVKIKLDIDFAAESHEKQKENGEKLTKKKKFQKTTDKKILLQLLM